MKTVKVTYTGVTPLLMNSVRGLTDRADSKYERYKELMSIRSNKRTEDESKELDDLTFYFSLYKDTNGYVTVSDEVIYSNLIKGAKASRDGQNAKRAILSIDNIVFKCDGKQHKLNSVVRNPNYRDVRLVRIGSSKVPHSRGWFVNWELEYELLFDDDEVSLADIKRFIQNAGKEGIGDMRPRYGRFTFKIVE